MCECECDVACVVNKVGGSAWVSSKDCATQDSETLKSFLTGSLGSREVAVGAGGVVGHGVVVCERHVDLGKRGLGHGRPGGGRRAHTTPLACLTWDEVACHRAEKPPRLRAGMGILGVASPTLVLCHLCVCRRSSPRVWVGGLGSLAAWLPFRLGMRRIPGGISMDIDTYLV